MTEGCAALVPEDTQVVTKSSPHNTKIDEPEIKARQKTRSKSAKGHDQRTYTTRRGQKIGKRPKGKLEIRQVSRGSKGSARGNGRETLRIPVLREQMKGREKDGCTAIAKKNEATIFFQPKRAGWPKELRKAGIHWRETSIRI